MNIIFALDSVTYFTISNPFYNLIRPDELPIITSNLPARLLTSLPIPLTILTFMIIPNSHYLWKSLKEITATDRIMNKEAVHH
jgi:hypothetical protein